VSPEVTSEQDDFFLQAGGGCTRIIVSWATYLEEFES
jgi:hypothetical protein